MGGPAGLGSGRWMRESIHSAFGGVFSFTPRASQFLLGPSSDWALACLLGVSRFLPSLCPRSVPHSLNPHILVLIKELWKKSSRRTQILISTCWTQPGRGFCLLLSAPSRKEHPGLSPPGDTPAAAFTQGCHGDSVGETRQREPPERCQGCSRAPTVMAQSRCPPEPDSAELCQHAAAASPLCGPP